MRRPNRKSLPEEVAEILAAEIKTGRWGQTLPGYRVLCDLLGVGRRAVLGALEILTAEGILLPPQGRMARKISADLGATFRFNKRIRTVAAVARESLDYIDRTIVAEFQRGLGREWNFEHLKSHAFQLKQPGKALDQLVERNPNCRWVFLSPTHEIAQWVERSPLDVICLGGDVADTETRTLSVSLTEMTVTHVKELLDLGHKRICIPFQASSPAGTQRIVTQLEGAFREKGVPFSRSYNLPAVRSDKPEVLWRLFQRLFASTPPTAIIATSMEWYLLLLSFCRLHGISIPKDLSIALQASDPLIDWVRPKPPTVEFPIRRFISQLNLWAIKGPEVIPPSLTNLQPKFTPGESIGPPPLKPRTLL